MVVLAMLALCGCIDALNIERQDQAQRSQIETLRWEILATSRITELMARVDVLESRVCHAR
jgi:hypothetical protein